MNNPLVANAETRPGKPQEQILRKAGHLLIEISDRLFWLSLLDNPSSVEHHVKLMQTTLQPRVLELLEEIREQLPAQSIEADTAEYVAAPQGGEA